MKPIPLRAMRVALTLLVALHQAHQLTEAGKRSPATPRTPRALRCPDPGQQSGTLLRGSTDPVPGGYRSGRYLLLFPLEPGERILSVRGEVQEGQRLKPAGRPGRGAARRILAGVVDELRGGSDHVGLRTGLAAVEPLLLPEAEATQRTLNPATGPLTLKASDLIQHADYAVAVVTLATTPLTRIVFHKLRLERWEHGRRRRFAGRLQPVAIGSSEPISAEEYARWIEGR
jgi:hypothetical protein